MRGSTATQADRLPPAPSGPASWHRFCGVPELLRLKTLCTSTLQPCIDSWPRESSIRCILCRPSLGGLIMNPGSYQNATRIKQCHNILSTCQLHRSALPKNGRSMTSYQCTLCYERLHLARPATNTLVPIGQCRVSSCSLTRLSPRRVLLVSQIPGLVSELPTSSHSLWSRSRKRIASSRNKGSDERRPWSKNLVRKSHNRHNRAPSSNSISMKKVTMF